MLEGTIIVEKLIKYAKCFLNLSNLDETYFRNILLSELKLNAPHEEELDLTYIKNLEVPDSILQELANYAVSKDIIKEYNTEHFCSYIMGILSPKPSEVNTQFIDLKENISIDDACNYLYNLSIKNNYIQKTAIDRNLKWEAKDGGNILEITINLSKPEKDNKEIAKLLTKAVKSNYPKCFLCKENEGFEGTLSHPPRVNLRTVSIKLNDEDWFVQYSPYLYYNEHCIAISKNHIPMVVNGTTIIKLLDFVDFFPNYFIGSNASLPIVGGSILNHEHFQGGRHTMPMHKAKNLREFKSDEFPDANISIVDWYNSTIRIVSSSRESITGLGAKIISAWSNYTDESCNILSSTDGTPHNAITPILRKLEDSRYVLELILRNNRTNEQYPDGIFHAHPEYHNIKKEGIGIIEVMGLFILPGRLKKQMEEIADILSGKTVYNAADINAEHNLAVHKNMIEKLINEHGTDNDISSAENFVKAYINQTCIKVLGCTAVFKRTELGQSAFSKFLSSMDIK